MIIEELLTNSADAFPDNTAAVHGSHRFSYRQLYTLSTRLAGSLNKMGLKKGDRVIISLENSFEYMISYFGVLYAGGVVVAINSDIKGDALSILGKDCQPAGLIISGKVLNGIDPLIHAGSLSFAIVHGEFDERSTEGILTTSFSDCCMHDSPPMSESGRDYADLASIIYTSGTTGNPKGVMLSHKNLLSNTASIVQYLGLSEKDSVMVVLPFHYSYGNSLLLTHIKQGGSLIIDNRFLYPNVVLETMVREKATGLAGVPSTYAILLKKSNFRRMSFPSLRYITQAGGPMHHKTALELLEVLPDVKLFIMYGQTEASARLSYLSPENLLSRPGSIGKGIPGVELSVRNEHGVSVKPGEVGEIVASGDNIMMGYWGMQEDTEQVLISGRLHTGDMATVDSDGYLYVVSRKKEMIKSGAHRIAPREIENVLSEHPVVFETAVVGQSDPILGEAILAFVVFRDGEGCTEKELLHHCHERLPSYKCPKSVRFVATFPKTESGKIKKEELKKIYNIGGLNEDML